MGLEVHWESRREGLEIAIGYGAGSGRNRKNSHKEVGAIKKGQDVGLKGTGNGKFVHPTPLPPPHHSVIVRTGKKRVGQLNPRVVTNANRKGLHKV